MNPEPCDAIGRANDARRRSAVSYRLISSVARADLELDASVEGIERIVAATTDDVLLKAHADRLSPRCKRRRFGGEALTVAGPEVKATRADSFSFALKVNRKLCHSCASLISLLSKTPHGACACEALARIVIVPAPE